MSFNRVRASLVVILALVALVAALPSGASAKHRVHRADPVAASGLTLFGVPWQATVPGHNPGVIQFSVDSRKRFSRGWLARLSVPSSAPNVFTAATKTSIDPRPEGELAGVTSPSVALIDVHMSDGSILELYPTSAPPAAVRRKPWLGGLRFFDGFFPGGAVPLVVDALDANNAVLAERTSDQGHF